MQVENKPRVARMTPSEVFLIAEPSVRHSDNDEQPMAIKAWSHLVSWAINVIGTSPENEPRDRYAQAGIVGYALADVLITDTELEIAMPVDEKDLRLMKSIASRIVGESVQLAKQDYSAVSTAFHEAYAELGYAIIATIDQALDKNR